MPVVGDVTVKLGSDIAGFAAGMGAARSELKATADAANGPSGGGLSGAMGLAAKAVVGLTLVGAAGGLGLAKMAGDFQSLTTQVVTGAGESVKNLAMIRDGLLQMAGEVGATPDALAKGLYNIESAGFHGAAGLDILRISAEGAKVGQADQAVVADALTSALNAYGVGADQATNYTNDLVATVAAGKMHMSDLAASIGGVLAPAAAFGVSLPEVSAALATMTSQGTDAATATTYLKQTILSLGAEKDAGVAALKDIGLAADDVRVMMRKQPDGFIEAIRTVSEHLATKFPQSAALAVAEFAKVKAGTETADEALANLSANGGAGYINSLRDIAGGQKQMMGMLELSGGHLETLQGNFDSITGAINNSNGTVNGWSLVQKDFNTKVDQAGGALSALGITIGTTLLTPLGNVATFASQVIGQLSGVAQPAGAASGAATDLGNALKGVGGFIGSEVVPKFQAMVGYVNDHIVPGFVNLGHTVMDIAGFVKDHLIPPIVDIAQTVGPPMIAVFRFFTDHAWLAEGAIAAFAARWVLVKGLNIAGDILAFGRAFLAFAGEQGVLSAVGAVGGAGSSGGFFGAIRNLKPELQTVGAGLCGPTGLGSQADCAARGLKGAAGEAEGMAKKVVPAAEKAAGAGVQMELFGAKAVTAAEKAAGTGVQMELFGAKAVTAATSVASVGTAAAETAGGFSIAGLGAAGLATGGIAILLAATAALVFDVGGARTKIANFFAGGGNDSGLKDKFIDMATTSDKVGQDIVGGMHKTSADIFQTFKSGQGFFAGLTGDGIKATQQFVNTFLKADQQGKAMLDDLANAKQWDTLKGLTDRAAHDAGNYNTALHELADAGDTTAKAMVKSMTDASYQQAADIERVRRAGISANDDAVSSTYTAWMSIKTAYGEGSAKAAEYIQKNLTPEQQRQIADIQTIADKLGITTDQVIEFGRNGTLQYGNVKGSVAEVTAGMEAARQKEVDLANQADVVNGKFAVMTALALSAAANIRAIANIRVSVTGDTTTSGGGIQAQHGAIVNAPASGLAATLHGIEAVVPKDRTAPWLWTAMTDTLAGRAPSLPMAEIGVGAASHAPGAHGTGAGGVCYSPTYILKLEGTDERMLNQVRQLLAQHDAEFQRDMTASAV